MPKQQTKDLCRNVKVSVPESKISGMEMKSARMARRFRQKYKTLWRGSLGFREQKLWTGAAPFRVINDFLLFYTYKK